MLAIERGCLVGIFAVAHVLDLDPLAGEDVREGLGALALLVKAREVVRDRGIIGGGVRKHLLCKGKAGFCADFALLADFLNHLPVVGRIDDHGHGFMVLGCRADHRGAADVNVFNGHRESAVGAGDRLGERIQVHAHDVDRVDAVVGNRLHVLGNAAACKDAAVNMRIKRLDAPVEHFGKARVFGHFLAGDSLFLEEPCGAARRKDVIAKFHKVAGEVNNAGLVGHADQGLFSHLQFPFSCSPREARTFRASCAECCG